jgi:hypothetical protein
MCVLCSSYISIASTFLHEENPKIIFISLGTSTYEHIYGPEKSNSLELNAVNLNDPAWETLS